MQKIKIHPAFMVLAVIMLGLGKVLPLLCCFICVAVHEYAHFYVAKSLGYVFDTLEIMPYGAVLYSKEGINPQAERKIALAGPLSNLLLATFLAALWWIFPVTYNYSLTLFRVSLVIAIINLLPVYPLDGGRVVYSLLKNKRNAFKLMRFTGLFLALLCFAGFIASAFYDINYSLGIFSVLIATNAITDTQSLHYYHICSRMTFEKTMNVPIEIRELEVYKDITLKVLTHSLKPNIRYTVTIIGDDDKVIKKLDEAALGKLLLSHRLNEKIGEAILNT